MADVTLGSREVTKVSVTGRPIFSPASSTHGSTVNTTEPKYSAVLV